VGIVDKAKDTIDLVAEKADEVLLFCSLGKDSLTLLDLVYPRFKRVVCVFMYFVPELDHINRYIAWVKAHYPRVEFTQVPHWNLTYILRAGMYCVPNPKVKLLELSDVERAMRAKYGINYVFLGMKKADSLSRRLMLMTIGHPYITPTGDVYPLSEWTGKEVLSYMKAKNLPIPVRYSKRASGGVGFNLDCFLWMREHAPQDLQKFLRAFPMSEKILWDYDKKNEKEFQQTA